MRALWLSDQILEFRNDLAVPIPYKDEALVHVRLAGICSTDLELINGYYPFTGVPGHEFVGDVVSTPSASTWVGKRVVGEINIACGECTRCLSGIPRHCENRKTLGIHEWNGAFAENLILPISNLHAVPDHIPDESAVFIEPLAAAYEIIDQGVIHPGDRILVVGAGRLGQLIAQVLWAAGYDPEVLIRHTRQRDLL